MATPATTPVGRSTLPTPGPAPERDPDGAWTHTAAPAEVLDGLSHLLLTSQGLEGSLAETLTAVVAGAVAALPRVTGAGVSLVERDGTVSYAPSDAVVATLDALQDELGEGPRDDCIRDRGPVVSDLAVTGVERWPRLAPVALTHRVGAVCSVGLLGRDAGVAGALNLYAVEPGTFDASCVAVAALVASHSALAVHAARRIAGLTEALGSRDVIGRAKGILVQRFGLSDQQAFDRLVEASQHTNMKVRDVAAWLVDDTAAHRVATPSHRPPRVRFRSVPPSP